MVTYLVLINGMPKRSITPTRGLPSGKKKKLHMHQYLCLMSYIFFTIGSKLRKMRVVIG